MNIPTSGEPDYDDFEYQQFLIEDSRDEHEATEEQETLNDWIF